MIEDNNYKFKSILYLMEDNYKITFYYDFSNPKNSAYSMRMFSYLIQEKVPFRCNPIKTGIEPEIIINSPNRDTNNYPGSFLDFPEVLENLKRDFREIKESQLAKNLSGSEHFPM